MNPIEIANPQLFVQKRDEEGFISAYEPFTPTEQITLTKQEKAWTGLALGSVGTAILVTAGFIDDPRIKGILFAIGGLVSTIGVKAGVFQVANSEVKL